MQPLTGPDPNELDLDIATWLEAGQADHPCTFGYDGAVLV